MFLRFGCKFLCHRACDFTHVHCLEFREDQIHFLKEQDVVDKRNDLLDVARDRLDPSRELVAAHQALLQHLEVSTCDHERRTEFMGNVCEKFAACQFLLCKLLICLCQFA